MRYHTYNIKLVFFFFILYILVQLFEIWCKGAPVFLFKKRSLGSVSSKPGSHVRRKCKRRSHVEWKRNEGKIHKRIRSLFPRRRRRVRYLPCICICFCVAPVYKRKCKRKCKCKCKRKCKRKKIFFSISCVRICVTSSYVYFLAFTLVSHVNRA